MSKLTWDNQKQINAGIDDEVAVVYAVKPDRRDLRDHEIEDPCEPVLMAVMGTRALSGAISEA